MKFSIKNPDRLARIIILTTIWFMVGWETLLLLFPLKPFWRDEWCIIHNLKFKTAERLWGPLDFTQQFPRVYLVLLKHFTAALDCSYFSMRFPSWLAGMAAILLCWQLMPRILPGLKKIYHYVFVLIYLSFPVFMDYFVQIKHYEVELLLCLVALWQLHSFINLFTTHKIRTSFYILLCMSMAVCPFFSYTYPIAVTPIYLLVLLLSVRTFRGDETAKWRIITLASLPLILNLCSTFIFYLIDVKQLMADSNMHNFWKFRSVNDGNGIWSVPVHMWLFFFNVGPGPVVGSFFGIIGLSAWGWNMYYLTRRHQSWDDRTTWIRLYATLLPLLAILLFAAGKLPLGEPKFNGFAVPAIALLIMYFLSDMITGKGSRYFRWMPVFMFLALSANIFAGFFNNFTSAEYLKRIRIYQNTENAIKTARDKKMPLFITPAIGYPDDITVHIDFISMPTARGIVQTFPAYLLSDTICVEDINTTMDGAKLAPKYSGAGKALVGDGLNYTEYPIDIKKLPN